MVGGMCNYCAYQVLWLVKLDSQDPFKENTHNAYRLSNNKMYIA